VELKHFNFELPEELIALNPLPRGTSRLLHVPQQGGFNDITVAQLPSLLRAGDILVFNNTKVIPARLKGLVDGRKAEITLHKMHESDAASQVWSAFCKPAKKFAVGAQFVIAENFAATVLEIFEGGEIKFLFPYSQTDFLHLLEQHGQMPLPPYISKKRAEEKRDNETYQTIFADESKSGSVAAPTAGLHFTDELLAEIKEKGVQIEFVTLHVGGGTFLPVKTDDVTEHKMHAEFYEISSTAAENINAVKRAGGRVIPVGTTSLRTLESAANEAGQLEVLSGDTKIFIYPKTEKYKHKFKICDALFTNFHLPKSTLFMLISSITGIVRAQSAYSHAIANQYRFFSYGDSCFFEIAKN
jgi:S-adenosylmethionine:tRNA ribosyltransferase-isomerase